MNAAMTGAVVGALLGIFSFAVIRWAAARVEQSGGEQQKRSTGLMRATAVADLLIFPAIGYFVGPMVLAG